MIEQIVAVDWSGAVDERTQRESIWFCRVSASGQDIELDYGLTRDEMLGWLLALQQKCGSLFVGLDFAFSFPAWFVREHGGDAFAFWDCVGREGEAWLRDKPCPFYGHAGSKCTLTREQRYRRTELDLSGMGVQPKPAFQIGGAGHVGTGSLRGIPMLPALRANGFRIWPFEEPVPFTAAEIYPRYFTGPVKKTSAFHRKEALAKLRTEHPVYTRLSERQLACAELNENAFDALISGIEMWGRRDAAENLPRAKDETLLLEGAIYAPLPVLA